MNAVDYLKQISEILLSGEEWLICSETVESFYARRSELEVGLYGTRLRFSFPGPGGFKTWSVEAWRIDGHRIFLSLSRNFGKEQFRIELIPRIHAGELNAQLELARQEIAKRTARLIVASGIGKKLKSVSLKLENSRIAQVVFVGPDKKESAAIFDVTDTLTHESLLSAAVWWLSKLSARKKSPIRYVFIMASDQKASQLNELVSLLAAEWAKDISIVEIKNNELYRLEKLMSDKIFAAKVPKLSAVKRGGMSAFSRAQTEKFPAEVDCVYTRNGETLCFNGLPFARVRKVLGIEKIWFGIESKRRLLSENNIGEFREMLAGLKEYRRHDSPNRRHDLFRLGPESWLESILRKNIKLLDANLVLSPVYNQLRVSSDKIDLLALRTDGRLVVIELKVSADRDMVYQAADYWRKIEAQRRAGKIASSRIFGGQAISELPVILYLVAPSLSFHTQTQFFLDTLSPEIEIHRFGLNEDWRRELRVVERK